MSSQGKTVTDETKRAIVAEWKAGGDLKALAATIDVQPATVMTWPKQLEAKAVASDSDDADVVTGRVLPPDERRPGLSALDARQQAVNGTVRVPGVGAVPIAEMTPELYAVCREHYIREHLQRGGEEYAKAARVYAEAVAERDWEARGFASLQAWRDCVLDLTQFKKPVRQAVAVLLRGEGFTVREIAAATGVSAATAAGDSAGVQDLNTNDRQRAAVQREAAKRDQRDLDPGVGMDAVTERPFAGGGGEEDFDPWTPADDFTAGEMAVAVMAKLTDLLGGGELAGHDIGPALDKVAAAYAELAAARV